jgi:hypothetical protein
MMATRNRFVGAVTRLSNQQFLPVPIMLGRGKHARIVDPLITYGRLRLNGHVGAVYWVTPPEGSLPKRVEVLRGQGDIYLCSKLSTGTGLPKR